MQQILSVNKEASKLAGIQTGLTILFLGIAYLVEKWTGAETRSVGSILALVFGGMLYAGLFERRHPGVLAIYLKRVAWRATLFQFLLQLPVAFLLFFGEITRSLIFIASRREIDSSDLTILVVTCAIASVVVPAALYFFTKTGMQIGIEGGKSRSGSDRT